MSDDTTHSRSTPTPPRAGRRPRRFQSRNQEAAVQLLRVADVLRRMFSEVAEEHDVTLQQFNVLRILRGVHPEPLPTLEIGERMIERQPGVTRLVDRLQEKELVRRERCPEDRRLVHVWISDRGLDLLKGLDEPMDAADEAAVAALEPAEVDELLRLLGKLLEER